MDGAPQKIHEAVCREQLSIYSADLKVLLVTYTVKHDISENGGKLAVVMATAAVIVLLILLEPSSLCGCFLCFVLQQLINSFLFTASHQFLELAPDYSFSYTLLSDMVLSLLLNGMSQLRSI